MMNSANLLDRLLKNGKGFPKNLRLYYVLNKKHYFVNNGKIRNGFELNDLENLDRDSLLSVYGKMEFFFDEMIRLKISELSHDEKSTRLLYILSIVPINRKIRLFLDWKIFGREFTQKLSRLFEVRNDAVHCMYIDEIKYRKNVILSLAKKKDLDQFRDDLESAWSELLIIYGKQAQKSVNNAIKLVKKFQNTKK